jgi:signal transduction histidine kinase
VSTLFAIVSSIEAATTWVGKPRLCPRYYSGYVKQRGLSYPTIVLPVTNAISIGSEPGEGAVLFDKSPAVVKASALFARVAGVSTGLLGLIVLTGWWLKADYLKAIIPGSVPMKPNVAMGMVLGGVALTFLSRKRMTNVVRVVTGTAAGLVVMQSALTLVEHFCGWDLGIDLWLFGGPPEPGAVMHAGRMSPGTALCFLILGIALFAASFRIRSQIRLSLAAGLSVAAIVIALFPLLGFFLETLFGPRWNYMGMTISGVTAAVGFILLGCGLMAFLQRDAETRWSLHPFTTAGFALGILLMILAAASAFNFTKRMQETHVAVAYRQGVLKEIQQLLTHLQSLLGSERVYTIEGDEKMLEDRPATKAAVSETLGSLRQLATRNATQRQRLEQLEAAIARDVGGQEQVIAARREKGFAMAAGMLAADARSNQSSEVSRLLKEMQAEQYSLLLIDRKEAETTSLTTFMFLPMGVFLSLAILFLAFFFLNAGATEQKDADKALRESETEMRQLNVELDERVTRRTAELESANRDLESFSYSVSHDLRAPLRAIGGFSRIVLEDHSGAMDADGLRYLGLVEKSAQQMGQLIDDLLTFSRTGRQALAVQTVHTTDVVNACLTDLRSMQENRHVRINIGELPDCEADASLLKQVWLNLLANALKYTAKRDPAVITVGSRREGGTDSFFVQDNGAGFDMKYADKLFGVFQRLHLADDFEGTGVGLALVQRIVQRHGGRVWTEAKLNLGATFHFTLTGGPHV